MPHAVIVSPDPDNAAGGVERMCALLADVLAGDGWEVSVVGPEREPGRWRFRLGGAYLASSRSAMRGARGRPADLLITNGTLGFGPDGRRVPRVHVYHGTMIGDTRGEGRQLPVRERVRRILGGGAAEALAGRGATIVSVSEAAAEEVRRYYRVKTDVVIPNGVDTSVFRPLPRAEMRARLGLDNDTRYCLFVGRMQSRKGADLLLPACAAAGFELLIAGAAGHPGARHLGVLDPSALAEAYSAADCVLFPSRYEACSFVVLEALACGVPLLTTTVGWMRTFVQHVPAYRMLCVQPDHDDIVARLRGLDALDLVELTARAREWIEEHNGLDGYRQRWRELLGGLDVHWQSSGEQRSYRSRAKPR
jgi:glycosyltransferase involved in cell wall biosynthesis